MYIVPQLKEALMRYDELNQEQERSARKNADASYLAATIFVAACLLVAAFIGLMAWPR